MSERRARREKGIRHLWYGLGLAAAAAALVAVQVVPKLEDYELRSGGEPIVAAAGARAAFKGSSWRLIEVINAGPGLGDKMPDGTRGVNVLVGVTPGDEAASKAISKGCETSVSDARGRVWTSSSKVQSREKVSTLCTPIDDKSYDPILVRPGTEAIYQASFLVPADAVSSLRVEVRLPNHYANFVRLTPSGAPSGEPPRAG